MNGKFIIGDYIVDVKRIGKGSFSSIYLGYHKSTGEQVAVKKMELDSIKKISSRIRKEIKICKELCHENIVKTYDVIYDRKGGNVYLILEYCSKGDLSEFLKGRALKEKHVKSFMRQISFGLKYLLTHNIIHRDLKPQNILINNDGILKIADFGFARYLEKNSLIDTLCGTPLYMAPEIIRKKKYNEKADLWSVGIIMYQMLFGQRPYNAKNIFDLIGQIEKNTPLYIPSEISSSGKSLLNQLLVEDPTNRISWEEFFNHKWFEGDGEYDSDNMVIQISKTDSIENIITKVTKSSYNEVLFKEEEESVDNSSIYESDYSSYEESMPKSIIEPQIPRSEPIDIPKRTISTSEYDVNICGYKDINENYIPKIPNKHIENSPMFCSEFVLINDEELRVIDKNNRDNYMDKESSDDDENAPQYKASSVKNYINNSIDYLKNSMYYFNLFKHGSM